MLVQSDGFESQFYDATYLRQEYVAIGAARVVAAKQGWCTK